jgi:hypothetical protein
LNKSAFQLSDFPSFNANISVGNHRGRKPPSALKLILFRSVLYLAQWTRNLTAVELILQDWNATTGSLHTRTSSHSPKTQQLSDLYRENNSEFVERPAVDQSCRNSRRLTLIQAICIADYQFFTGTCCSFLKSSFRKVEVNKAIDEFASGSLMGKYVAI